jgi:dTDP-4-amino-4,6-dideoxygalactose transaminase
MLSVTNSFLPPFEDYIATLKRAWDKKWLTNNGEIVQELEQKLKEYLGVKYFFFTGNGTIVLQMALKALEKLEGGEIITTPFSYVATTNAILWEGFTPVFVDIKPTDFCIDESKIEKLISAKTRAILATHVYGNPCNVEAIQSIAERYGLKVIYDGAHAFGSLYKNKQVLSYGDITTCSFHATKIFHTVEGGGIMTNDDALARKILLMRQFGHEGDNYYAMGINGKNSEFHAAMGLTNFPYIEEIIKKRKVASELYQKYLEETPISFVHGIDNTEYNYAYYPVIFESEELLLGIKQKLGVAEIYGRRYFFPSLNTLPFLKENFSCPISEIISTRVLCLPLSTEITQNEIKQVCEIIIASL